MKFFLFYLLLLNDQFLKLIISLAPYKINQVLMSDLAFSNLRYGDVGKNF